MVLSAVANGSSSILSNSVSITVNPSGQSITPFLVVRTGLRYATLAQAAATIQNGDTIRVASGYYTVIGANDPGNIKADINYDNITIEWETSGSPPVIDMSSYVASIGYYQAITMGAPCLNLTIRGIHIKGAGRGVPYTDASAIYCLPEYGNYQLGGNLTVEYCRFWNWSQGISTGLNPYNRVYLRYTTIEDCRSDDQHHGIYMMNGNLLDILGCTFKTTVAGTIFAPGSGHLVKSRAKVTTVRGTLFDGAGGCARCMDICNGGQVTVVGCTLLHYGTTLYADDNQPIRIGAEQQSGFVGTGEFRNDGRTHSVKFAQNTIRKVQPDSGPAYEILNIAPMVNADYSPATITTTDANGSMIRNNIAGSNTASAANFVAATVPVNRFDGANNTAVADTTISDLGVYSGGIVPGNPAVNDAAYDWGGEFTVPVARTDTNRGGHKATTPLEDAARSLTSGQWTQFRSGSQAGLSFSLFEANPGTLFGYIDKGVYDSLRKQMYFIGQGHTGQIRQIVYDEASDQFIKTQESWMPSNYDGRLGHGYQQNAIDTSNGNRLYKWYNNGLYEFGGGSWTQRTYPPLSFDVTAGAMAHIPGTRKMLFCGRSQARLFDLDTKTWSSLGDSFDIGYNHAIAQPSPQHGCVYFGGGNTDSTGLGFFKIGASLTVTTLTSMPFNIAVATTTTFVHPTNGNLYAMQANGTTWRAFDGSSWITPSMGSQPTLNMNDGLIAFTIQEYGVVAFLRRNSSSPDLWLWKP